MKQETYIKICNCIRKSTYGERLVRLINNLVTRIIYASFLVLLAVLILLRDESVIRIILVTGISFVLVSIFRHIYNAERPYIRYDFNPIIEKEKTGESMPSRHVFSAFVIAMAFGTIEMWMGVVALILGVIMAFMRVIAGVHFPKDVIAGALIGIFSGIVGFWLV